ncbi:hypothetical protein K402DRAFT_338103 [Aulographum hederae CBS 113979]|uniref:GDS1 winged helix domain-containing protein n=1 Tax=Aulographum hederae CBS 113979 TaxID=1176131 RepID=A0A6G1GSF7_9PEZI|nr:hypothetical protein K402DRAFT_338103 [Aulographum hederae CBS 113979]
MPYNTRRKSLSLPSLGIALPGNHSRSASHRSPPGTTASTPATGEQQPPTKKIKRSHTSSTSPPPATLQRRTTITFSDSPRKNAARVVENTPPPSPGDHGNFKIDTEGIDDDIVVGVIEQLEKTGNRPHLLKELAAVLSATLPIVSGSANQSAIISSRLTNYLRRPWTALGPCPVGKELVGTHPKRIYFFLTNQPRQPIPDPADIPSNTHRIISPSLSSAADDEDQDMDSRSRTQLSPSPEIDLFSPELEDDNIPEAPGTPFSGRGSLTRDGTHPPTTSNMSHNRRAVSPPLEHDEREFTQTASFLQQRSTTHVEAIPEVTIATTEPDGMDEDTIVAAVDESEESAARKNSEAAAALFGQAEHLMVMQQTSFNSSPMIKPTLHLDLSAPSKAIPSDELKMFSAGALDADLDEAWKLAELKSPESIDLDELEDMFEEY